MPTPSATGTARPARSSSTPGWDLRRPTARWRSSNTAVYEAVNAITRRYPAGALKLEAAPGASVDAAIAAAQPHRARQAASLTAGGDRRCLPGGAGKDRRRPRQGLGHRRGRAGRRRDPGVAGRGRRGCAGDVSTADDGGRLRADGDPRGHAMAAAQALAHDRSFAVPSRPAAGAEQRAVGARLQRGEGARRQEQLATHGRADADRRLLGERPCRRSTTGSSSRSPRPPVAK